jgi:hypothetical protein
MFTKQATEERKQDLCIATAIAKAPKWHEKWSPLHGSGHGDHPGVARLAEAKLRSRGPPGRLEEAMHSAESVPPNPFFMSRD